MDKSQFAKLKVSLGSVLEVSSITSEPGRPSNWKDLLLSYELERQYWFGSSERHYIKGDNDRRNYNDVVEKLTFASNGSFREETDHETVRVAYKGLDRVQTISSTGTWTVKDGSINLTYTSGKSGTVQIHLVKAHDEHYLYEIGMDVDNETLHLHSLRPKEWDVPLDLVK